MANAIEWGIWLNRVIFDTSHKITSATRRLPSSAPRVQCDRQEPPMTRQISPLRQRMIDVMTFRNMSPNCEKVCTYAVTNFSAFHGRSSPR